jgi:DNA-binding protein H-NS
MPTLEQIQAKIAKLQSQAEVIAAKQASVVLREITSLMAANSITTTDIDAFLSTKKPRGRPAGKTGAKSALKVAAKKRGRPTIKPAGTVTKGKMPAKYLNPKTGETWSGHARPPAWIKDVKDRSKFLIDGSGVAEKPTVTVKKTAAKKVSAKKNVSKPATKKTRGVRASKAKQDGSTGSAAEATA